MVFSLVILSCSHQQGFLIKLKLISKRDRENLPVLFFTPQTPAVFGTGLGPDPGAWNATQASAVEGRNPAIIPPTTQPCYHTSYHPGSAVFGKLETRTGCRNSTKVLQRLMPVYVMSLYLRKLITPKKNPFSSQFPLTLTFHHLLLFVPMDLRVWEISL